METAKSYLIITSLLILLQTSVAIIGGPHVWPDQITYQVSLRFKNTGTHFCSGAILNNWWILTANRCVNIHPIETIKAVYGTHRLSVPAIQNKIAFKLMHPQYNPQIIENNIALLMTKNRIEYVPGFVSAIQLPHRPLYVNEVAVISGWGVDEKQNERWEMYSNILRFQTTKRISTDECKARIGPLGSMLQNTTICTTNPVGRGICKGDLGGPLVGKDNMLVGIASWYLGCAEGQPDVYTDVYPFVEWIKLVTGVTIIEQLGSYSSVTGFMLPT